MAKVLDNLVTEGLSGKLGRRLVFRKGKAGMTILSTRPVFSAEREFNPAQQAHHEAFKQATTYAKVAKNQPLYVELAKGTPMNAYNIAVQDWFGEPQVLDIDITAWTGQIGQEIRVKAKDNVKVASVHVMIRESNGSTTAIEEGEAVPSNTDGLLWTYTTKTLVPMTPGTRLDVMAKDLPGNIGGNALELN
jgi:hypothetical protein